MKKKILIRIGSLRHGGAEKVLVTFLNNLDADKYEVDLLLNLYSGKYLKEIPDWVEVYYLNKGEMITTNRLIDIPQKAFRVIFQKVLKMYPRLLYTFILKGKKYDIEFAAIHGFRDEILKSPQKKSKKIVWIHNDLRETEFHDYTDDEVCKFFKFDKIMVISRKIQEDFERMAKTPEDKEKIIRIYNPLDTREILRNAKLEQDKYEFDPDVPTFVSVGTVFPQKGFDRLLRVHKQLIDEGLPHKVLIVGDGYDFENVKKLKKDLGLDETATMLGFTHNPYPYFEGADFFILSSRYEGFPTVLYEAITLKKPIIATDVSGVREMLDEGRLGLIVENSEAGIYEGMKRFITDDKLVEGFKDKVANFAPSFDLVNSVKSIEAILDNL